MRSNNRVRMVCLTLWSCLMAFLLMAPSVRAEDQSRDGQMIEPQTETQTAASQDMTQPGESATVELSKAVETPMKTTEDEDGTLKELITPNIADFERARESDTQSSVSF